MVNTAFGRPVRIGYLLQSGYPKLMQYLCYELTGRNTSTTLADLNYDGIERSRWRGIEFIAGVGVPTTFLPSAGGASNE
jgi:hypothetical protein